MKKRNWLNKGRFASCSASYQSIFWMVWDHGISMLSSAALAPTLRLLEVCKCAFCEAHLHIALVTLYWNPLTHYSLASAKHTGSNQDTRLAALEDRASRLEKILESGASSDNLLSISRVPVASVVEDLRMRVQALHPAHVDSLHSRITQLLSKLQQVTFLQDVMATFLAFFFFL